MPPAGDRESADGRCSHGCVALPPPDHAVYRFMNAFDHAWNYNMLPLVLKNTFEKHPEVWNDAEHRHMATGILLSMGTNMILIREDGDVNYRT